GAPAGSDGPTGRVGQCYSWLPSPGVALETGAGLRQQVWRHAQVNLGAGQVDMSQVDRQVMEQLLYVRPLSVPGGQAVDRKGVPHYAASGIRAVQVSRWRGSLVLACPLPLIGPLTNVPNSTSIVPIPAGAKGPG